MSISDEQILFVINNQKLINSFWLRVNKTDTCWYWLGDTSHKGYGRFCPTKGMCLRAHRVSYALENKKIPVGIIRHSCDNRSCVNPRHLIDGTQKENVDDMFNRERANRVKYKDTHCIHGHEFIEGSYYINMFGSRLCKACLKSRKKHFTNV